MIQRRGLTIFDLMLGVIVAGLVVRIVVDPYMAVSPSFLIWDFRTGGWDTDPSRWLYPATFLAAITSLGVAGLASRLVSGNRRTFLGGMALGGWLMFLLIFGCKDHSSPPAWSLPIGGFDALAEPVDKILWGVSPSRPFTGPGICYWRVSVCRVSQTIGSVVTLLVGSGCGLLALQLTRREGSRAWSQAAGNRAIRLSALLLTAFVGLAVFRGDSSPSVVKPILTAAVGLFILAAVVACYGPRPLRPSYGALACVGLIYLGAAFSRWEVVNPAWLPEGWVAEWLGSYLVPAGKDDPWGANRYYKVRILTDYGHVVGAWSIGLMGAWVVPRIRERLATPRAANNLPKGEPCPS